MNQLLTRRFLFSRVITACRTLQLVSCDTPQRGPNTRQIGLNTLQAGENTPQPCPNTSQVFRLGSLGELVFCKLRKTNPAMPSNRVKSSLYLRRCFPRPSTTASSFT